MKIYHSLTEAHNYKLALRAGEELKPVHFYEETEELKNDYDNNPDSDWWWDEFDSIEKAEDNFYNEVGLEYWESFHP